MRKSRKTSSSAPTDRGTQWAIDVVEGRVVAGPHIRNACRRHLDDLKRAHERGLVYSVEKADRACRFFETKLRLNGGQFEGKPFLLHPSQAFKLSCLFGWLRADGTRRFRRAYIEEGKGNGKSPFAGGVGLYGMMADDEPGAEIYAVAAHRDQAKILFNDAVTMVDQSPDLASRITQSGGPGRVFNMAWLAKGAFFRPLSKSAGKSGSGLRPHMGLADELHEHPNRDAVEMIERGFKFRRQPLLLQITNSGSDRNSICYEEHEHAVKVAAGTLTPGEDFAYVGEPIDDTTFSFVCSLDLDDKPLEDPSCWIKANPLLGTILTHDYLAGVVAQAKALPGKLNGILRLHFCVWTDADTAWMSRAVLEPCLADFDPVELHAGKTIGIGIDLSQNRDITAKAAVVETGSMTVTIEVEGAKVNVDKPTYDAWIEAWTPGDTIRERSTRDKTPYDVWAVAQTTYRLVKSSLGIIIFDQRSFGLVVNGTLIRRFRTSGRIQRAGWAGGFGTGAGSFAIADAVLFKGKRSVGIKPLRLIGIGDSTNDEAVVGQSPFDFARQFIAGIGGTQVELLTNIAQSGHTSAQQRAKLQAMNLAGQGYDLAFIAIGINDIQTAVAPATFVSNVMAMVTQCRAAGIEPLVAPPAMFYSKPDAQAFAQDGGATAHSADGAEYRLALMRALAGAGVYCSLASFEDMGAVIPALITLRRNGAGDAIVAENIHPTSWGCVLQGWGWAKGAAAYLTHAAQAEEGGTPLPASYFTGGVGATATPRYTVEGKALHLSHYLSRDGVALADGATVATLPKRLRPRDDVIAPLVNADAGTSPIPATPAGFWRVGSDGAVRVYGVAGSPTFVGISASWKI